MYRTDAITREDFLEVMQRHIGAENGASAAQLVRELLVTVTRDGAAERRVRKLVEQLRREGEHICAHPRAGYFMAATEEELEETCEYLSHRAMTSLAQVSGMKRTSIPDLVGQLRLPT